MMYEAIAQRDLLPSISGKPYQRTEKLFYNKKDAIMWLIEIKNEWMGNETSDFIMLKQLKNRNYFTYMNKEYMFGFQIWRG